ncbi:exodeoxyribonuclease VII small subunit [Streptomyces sp. NPDC057682]|uniref:exodeoxyribonuclease VII small subunit n=1 Tax=unclassified Streptomyces TaxID=2593676 RepID=UPI00365872C0
MTDDQGAASAATAATGTLGYEQARDELIEVVRRLEAGGTSLEDSLALWERGEELAGVCRRWLEGARARLDAALADPEDGPGGARSAGTE